ncbi:hypothetical protein SMRU11_24000 [Sinorhizobium meliloti RU11/001]|nr:hypothetical protein SMRU11_24000 [Sinorhizobium meliloti RU11/001]
MGTRIMKGASRLVVGTAIASGAWLITAIAIGWSAKECADGGTFRCMAASEWGDFFAGIFAPVAFLWLVVAVIIQSRELAAQRKELALTRTEVEANRKAMEAQVEESKRQAEFIGEQTKAITQGQHDSDLKTRLRLLRNWVIENCVTKNDGRPSLLTGSMPEDTQDFFVELVKRLLLAEYSHRVKLDDSKLNSLLAIDHQDLYYVCDRLIVISEMIDDVSPSMRTILKASNVSRVARMLLPVLPRPTEEDKVLFPTLFNDDEEVDAEDGRS